MLTKSDTWKLQDAKARFSEVVRRARAGEPQRVTVHGKEAVAVVDTERFDIVPKRKKPRTMREFIEGSKKYRGLAEGIDFERRSAMSFRDKRREIFDADFVDENKT
jgi:antitoxin Phd